MAVHATLESSQDAFILSKPENNPDSKVSTRRLGVAYADNPPIQYSPSMSCDRFAAAGAPVTTQVSKERETEKAVSFATKNLVFCGRTRHQPRHIHVVGVRHVYTVADF